MVITVLVPSYRRPDLLRNCLAALGRQTRLPDEVVVVLRDVDHESREEFARIAATSRLRLRLALADRPGQMAAMNTGLAVVSGEIVCLTDDDAEPLPDWVARIESRFQEDPLVGAVGGRDHVHFGGVPAPTRPVAVVGKIQWFGRDIGNHSQDSSGYRQVDTLKGCNMSLRTDMGLRFDERLRGDAYQNEVAVCLEVRALGRKVMFDPEIRVNHFVGARMFGSERSGIAPERLANNSFNHMLVRCAHLPRLRLLAYLLYSFGVGDRATPGLMKAALLARGDPIRATRILLPSLRGKLSGLFAAGSA